MLLLTPCQKPSSITLCHGAKISLELALNLMSIASSYPCKMDVKTLESERSISPMWLSSSRSFSQSWLASEEQIANSPTKSPWLPNIVDLQRLHSLLTRLQSDTIKSSGHTMWITLESLWPLWEALAPAPTDRCRTSVSK